MKRFSVFALSCLVLGAGVVFGQDDGDKLRAFQRNFLRASLTTKIQVLQDAADETDVDMGPLYLQALDFAIENATFLRDDPSARDLAILAVRLVGISGHREALTPLWDLFSIDRNSSVRIEVLNAIAELAPPDPEIVQRLNRWVMSQNQAYRDGEAVDESVLAEAAVTLGVLGSESSFPVLFSMSTVGYPDMIGDRARQSLYKIEGDFTDLIERVIRENPATEKLEALRIAIANESLSAEEKARIASGALEVALEMTPRRSDEREYQRQIRFEAIRVLTDNAWSSATKNVIAHFNLVLEEFSVGTARVSHVLEAVDALGAMGTHEAAERLSLYLDVLNSDVENGKNYEEQIVLAVIRNLGILGDRAAFDRLLYANYLNYSERVKKAATEAINKL